MPLHHSSIKINVKARRSSYILSKIIWKASLPLKIKIFTWQLAIDRLPSSEQINHRFGPSDGLCVMCGQVETANHIFFSCAFAAFMWSGVRSILQVNWNPTSFAQFFSYYFCSFPCPRAGCVDLVCGSELGALAYS
jgi:hypothetical protein